MRAQLLIPLVLVGALTAMAPAAYAAGPLLAQENEQQDAGRQKAGGGGDLVDEEEEAEGQESADEEDAARETGAGEEETEGAATETGPPWTYQMAWLGVLMLLGLAAGIGLAYYTFVVRRQKGLT